MRAVHPDELKKIEDGAQLIDYEWYLTQQLHASISRLCAVIPGTDGARIAECLGLDGSKYKSSSSTSRSSEVDEFNFNADEQQRFRNCNKLIVFCTSCKQFHPFAGVFDKLSSSSLDAETEEGDDIHRTSRRIRCGFVCPNCSHPYDPRLVSNALQLAIRRHVSRYYNGWMICEESTCAHRSKSAIIKNDKFVISFLFFSLSFCLFVFW